MTSSRRKLKGSLASYSDDFIYAISNTYHDGFKRFLFRHCSGNLPSLHSLLEGAVIFNVFFLEILFWMMQAGILFYILYRVNQGELRIYIVLASLFGFSAYQALAKQVYKRLLERLIRIFKAIYQGIEKLIKILLISPLRWIFFTFYRMIKAILIGVMKIIIWLFLFFIYSFAVDRDRPFSPFSKTNSKFLSANCRIL